MEVKTRDVTKMSLHELAAYIDKEALPFIRMNEKAAAAGREPPFLNPRLEAIRYELVKRPDGTIQKKERYKPLLQEVGEVSNQWLCEARVTRSDGERVLSQQKKGKYNDAELLEVCTPCSVEMGEVASWRGDYI